MLYASDEHHELIRYQAVERVKDYPEDYQDFFLHEHDSPEAYIEAMGENGFWADDAIVRATADAMDIQIQVISSLNDFIPVVTTSSGNPIQTIFLGQITDTHYMATSPKREAQQIAYGGFTTDGISISGS